MAEPTDLSNPITYDKTPTSVYSDYEMRQQELNKTRPIFDESSIIAPHATIDSTYPTPSQLELELSPKFEGTDYDVGPPQDFSTATLFTREALMQHLGPPSHQEVLLDKLSELTLSSKTPQEEKILEQTTSFLEEVQNLNLIAQSVFQEQDRIGKA